MILYGWEKFGCEQERYHEIIREVVGVLGSLRGENWNEELCRTDVCHDVNIIFQAHKEPRRDLRTIRDRLRATISQLENAERAKPVGDASPVPTAGPSAMHQHKSMGHLPALAREAKAKST